MKTGTSKTKFNEIHTVSSFKRIVLIMVVCLQFGISSVIADDRVTFESATWNWTEIGEDGAVAGKASFTSLFGAKQVINIIKYNESKLTTSLVCNEGKNVAKTTSSAAVAEGATVAINGSFFDNSVMSATYQYTCVPVWYKNELRTRNDNPKRCTGIIGFTSTGEIGFEPYDEASFESLTAKYESYIASGPLLRLNNENQTIPEVDNSFDGVNPRSMIGVTADRTIYMIVVEGRKSNATGVYVKDMQKLAEWLELTDAINLDGGGSSTLWGMGQGVINSLSDSRERVIPSLIVAKDKSAVADDGPQLVDNYYQIATAEDLFWFASRVNKGYGAINAKLTADIDLEEKEWVPIGATESMSFSGNFDGQGHYITGLSINRNSGNSAFIGFYAGNGTVNSFSISGTINYTGNTGDDCVAGIVGRNNGNLTVSDVICDVDINTPNAKGVMVRIAGIVAWMTDGTINRCWYASDINAAGTTGQASGIVGLVTKSTKATISNCLFSGTITATNSGVYSGGIAGYANLSSTNFSCTKNLSIGTIDASGSNIGAIIGGKGNRSSASSYTNNYILSGLKACGTVWNSAVSARTATNEQLTDGTTLNTLGTDNWAQGKDYPIPSDPSAPVTRIETLQDGLGATVAGIYDLNGIRHANYQKGINIIKLFNGKTKTVLTK